MPEANQALKRYLSIPPEQRLKVVEDNLAVMVQVMLGEEPGKVAVNLDLRALMLDIVREIRQIKEHLGLLTPKDSKPSTADEVESPGVGTPEIVDDSEIPPSLLHLVQ